MRLIVYLFVIYQLLICQMIYTDFFMPNAVIFPCCFAEHCVPQGLLRSSFFAPRKEAISNWPCIVPTVGSLPLNAVFYPCNKRGSLLYIIVFWRNGKAYYIGIVKPFMTFFSTLGLEQSHECCSYKEYKSYIGYSTSIFLI